MQARLVTMVVCAAACCECVDICRPFYPLMD